ncbi:MAG: ABC transporter ATP-binding protein [Bdellovibrionota bacterium]
MSLEINALSKHFFQGETKIDVLHDLNVLVKSAEIVAILGQSGSGKSTLLSLIAGLEKPNSGKIIIDDVNIVPLSERQVTQFRANSLSLVFQQYHLISHLTAIENVSLPLEILRTSDAELRAEALLKDLGLGHRLHHFPNQLSGGECQRVAIARALVTNPKVLLADEPSGNLDIDTGEKVMETFLNLVRKHKTTTVIVTHNENLARKCQRSFRLKAGQLIEINW